jgi:hypothetical protein
MFEILVTIERKESKYLTCLHRGLSQRSACPLMCPLLRWGPPPPPLSRPGHKRMGIHRRKGEGRQLDM